MKTFLPPFVVFLILTPLFLLLGFLTAGAGHGTYLFAKALFPFTMLSTLFFNVITVPFLLLGLVQFPAYGAVIGLANTRGLLRPSIIGISLIHIFAVIACLALIGESFS